MPLTIAIVIMAVTTKRKSAFTSEELEVLSYKLNQNPSLALGVGIYGPGMSTPAEKRKRWEEITSAINAVGNNHRTWKDVRDKWKDLKSKIKAKECRRRQALKETCGVPPPKPLTDFEERILTLITKTKISGTNEAIETKMKYNLLNEQPPGTSTNEQISRLAEEDSDEGQGTSEMTVPYPLAYLEEASGTSTETSILAAKDDSEEELEPPTKKRKEKLAECILSTQQKILEQLNDLNKTQVRRLQTEERMVVILEELRNTFAALGQHLTNQNAVVYVNNENEPFIRFPYS